MHKPVNRNSADPVAGRGIERTSPCGAETPVKSLPGPCTPTATPDRCSGAASPPSQATPHTAAGLLHQSPEAASQTRGRSPSLSGRCQPSHSPQAPAAPFPRHLSRSDLTEQREGAAAESCRSDSVAAPPAAPSRHGRTPASGPTDQTSATASRDGTTRLGSSPASQQDALSTSNDGDAGEPGCCALPVPPPAPYLPHAPVNGVQSSTEPEHRQQHDGARKPHHQQQQQTQQPEAPAPFYLGSTCDPDYEIPTGCLTETEVLKSLAGRVKQDRYGFVIAVQEDDPVGDADDEDEERRRRRRRDSGAAASISNGMGRPGTRDQPARSRQQQQQLPRRRGQRTQQQQNAERERKWRKMLGPDGSALERYRRRRPDKLKRRVRKGIPDPWRGTAWLALSGGRQLMDSNPGLYAALLALDGEAAPGRLEAGGRPGAGSQPAATPSAPAPASPYGGVRGAVEGATEATGPAASTQYRAPAPDVVLCIMRDLNRTLPNHVLFMKRQSVGQKALYSVLWASAAYRPSVGYVQGMGFLAAVLLLYMPDEEAFWTLQALMQGSPGWREQWRMERLFTAGMPGLQCCLFQLKHLLREANPRLAAHLESEGIEPELYATHWFNTAFSYCLPFPHLLRVWDVFLAEGPKMLFRVGLAVLQYAEPRLLGLRFEALLGALAAKAMPELLPAGEPGELLRRAVRIPVSERLREVEEEWRQRQELQAEAGGGGGGPPRR